MYNLLANFRGESTVTAKNHTTAVSIVFLTSLMTEKNWLNRDNMYFIIPFLFSHYVMYNLLARFWGEWSDTVQNVAEVMSIMVPALLVAKKNHFKPREYVF